MQKKSFLFAVLLFPLLATCASGADAPADAPAPKAKGPHYIVYLLAGQSNMDGRGKVKDLHGPLEPYAKPLPGVLIHFSAGGLRRPLLQNEGFDPLHPGCSESPKTFGPELGFGHAMLAAAPDEKILLVKFAEGGTSLVADWTLSDPKKLYAGFIHFVKATERKITDEGADYEIRGMLWMQGEGDAGPKDNGYKKLLTELIAQTRADLNLPQLPFVIGQVYDNGRRNFVIFDEKAVAKEVPFTAFVESDGLKTWDHGTHFDAASQIELGKRFAREMLKLAPPVKK